MLQCKIFRLLFLLFLAVFARSPIVDAYSDSSCSPLVFFNDLDNSESSVRIDDLKLNEARKSLQSLNRVFRQNRYNRALLEQTAASVGPISRKIKLQLSSNKIKSHQSCPPLSSDTSPPATK
jgi:hypothetical protein